MLDYFYHHYYCHHHHHHLQNHLQRHRSHLGMFFSFSRKDDSFWIKIKVFLSSCTNMYCIFIWSALCSLFRLDAKDALRQNTLLTLIGRTGIPLKRNSRPTASKDEILIRDAFKPKNSFEICGYCNRKTAQTVESSNDSLLRTLAFG